MKKTEVIDEASLQVSGSSLPRRIWSRLNRFRTEHNKYQDMMYKWGLDDSTECDCGHHRQTMTHTLNECRKRYFPGGFSELHSTS